MSDSDEESNNSMDEEMKAKIAAFMEDVEDDDEEEAAEEEDDAGSDSDLKDLDVPSDLPVNTIDYLVIGTSDLEKGREKFTEMTGLKTGNLTAMRGGGGTKSVLCRLAGNVYIEIMAPDGTRTDGTPGALAKVPEGELIAFHYAVRSPPEAVNGMVPDSSWALDKITMVGTGSPLEFKEEDGPYKWDLTYLLNHDLGGCVPSFVNWRSNEAHPTCRLEDSGAKIKKVSVRVPEGHKVLGLLETVDGVKIVAGKPKLVFEIETPEKGKVKFEGKNVMGVVMPGYQDTSHQSYNK
ncbi:unnamed protein product [Cylindrotheca closterium]|uniref:Glyoxalase-like domain-containing protein n=1 Tax=Cylindrotheca closterium TaxID=2856 RepID=A0AAD2FKP2_9STRA|nr:unnamed protein product [Cylindrotheca closterium]